MDRLKRAAGRVKDEVTDLRTTVKAKLDHDTTTGLAGGISGLSLPVVSDSSNGKQSSSQITTVPLHAGSQAATMSLLDACLEMEGLDAATTRAVGECAFRTARDSDQHLAKLTANVAKEAQLAKDTESIVDATLVAGGKVGTLAAQLKESRRFLSMNCGVEFDITPKHAKVPAAEKLDGAAHAAKSEASSTETKQPSEEKEGADQRVVVETQTGNENENSKKEGASPAKPKSASEAVFSILSPTKEMRRMPEGVNSVSARFTKDWGAVPEDTLRVEAAVAAVEDERSVWLAKIAAAFPEKETPQVEEVKADEVKKKDDENEEETKE